MKYRKDGRTYELVPMKHCSACDFDRGYCSDFKAPCMEMNGAPIVGAFRETIPSKIANWIRGKK